MFPGSVIGPGVSTWPRPGQSQDSLGLLPARGTGRDTLFWGVSKILKLLGHQNCYRESAYLRRAPKQKFELKDGKRVLRASFEFMIQPFLTPDTHTSELYMPVIFFFNFLNWMELVSPQSLQRSSMMGLTEFLSSILWCPNLTSLSWWRRRTSLKTVTFATGCCFCFGSIPLFFLELFLHWSPVVFWAPTDLGKFLFQYPIILPFHTVHGVLKARMLKWFAIPFSSGPHSVRRLHHDPPILGGPTWHGLVSLS